jgi:hypothetical protein
LLATSTPEPIYRVSDGQRHPRQLSTSDNALLRLAGERLTASAADDGSAFADVWRRTPSAQMAKPSIARGTAADCGVLLPQAPYAAVASDMLRNIIYLALAVALFSIVIGLFVSDWIARPLRT